jgi:2-oxoglutarate dehydrogenase E1 component
MADDAGIINQVLTETSFLYGANAAFVEDLYARWAENPGSVEPSWAAFFATLSDQADQVKRAAQDPPGRRARRRPSAPTGCRPSTASGRPWPPPSKPRWPRPSRPRLPATSAEAVRAATLDSLRAIMMIRAYRMRGHLAANLDPLGLEPKASAPELEPSTYGFAEADYDRPIFLDFVLGMETSTIREILSILRRTYCDNVGVQYMHISDPTEKAWLQERIEGRDKEIVFSKEGKVAILKKLIEAEGFERFLHKRFPGTKRFGLDGGEACIPALEQIIKRGGALGVKEIVIGMPHRGRLNTWPP